LWTNSGGKAEKEEYYMNYDGKNHGVKEEK
jgi:hypothetical protein